MRTFLKYFFWALSTAIMVTVFCFSSQEADESQKTSEGLTQKVLMCFESFRNLSEEKQTEIIEDVQFFVRKGAHFSIYTALGISLFSAILLTFKAKFLWLWSWLIAVLYAISDEVHQFFVPGRSMEVRDMLIDSLGALLGILIVVLIKFIYSRKRVK